MRKIERLLASTFVFIALFLMVNVKARGQYENGSLVGTIRDSSGAPIANAAVTVTNTATAITSNTKTNGEGDYDVPSLRVGVYTITASAPGFASAEASDISVSVGGRQKIDLTLKVGGEATSVEVTGVALQVEAESSQRDQTVTQYQSKAFPLVSRNYSDLLALVPGVAAGANGRTDEFGELAAAGGVVQREWRAQHVQQLPSGRHG